MSYYKLYYIISVCITALLLVMLAWEDINRRYFNPEDYTTSKVGYNYSWDNKGLILFVVIITLPYVNLIAVVFVISSWFNELKSRLRVHKTKTIEKDKNV